MNVQDMRNNVLNFVRLNGPVLPVQVNKVIEKDTIFAGAILSELVANKLIKISFGKIGGSPVYYSAGQEAKLQILYNYLPQKEKEAYDLLRSKRFLRDKELDPAIRVALRNIKDFAVLININSGETNEIFWKWHLTTDTEAEELLKKFIQQTPIKETLPVEKEPLIAEKPVIETKPIAVEKPIEVKQEIKKKEVKPKVKDDIFTKAVEGYINQKKIKVISEELKKGKEIEKVIEVHSELGNLKFLLIAKDKKKINEADLSLANNKGQNSKLPVLYLSNGEISKKASNYIEKNLKGLLVFKKI